MKNILLWIWQLPQNLLGLAIWGFFRLQKRKLDVYDRMYESLTIIRTDHAVLGVALGYYIFVGRQANNDTYNHERGHSIQSRRFGLLYLFAVGIPSIIRNIRLPRQPGTWEERQRWYYSGSTRNLSEYSGS